MMIRHGEFSSFAFLSCVFLQLVVVVVPASDWVVQNMRVHFLFWAWGMQSDIFYGPSLPFFDFGNGWCMTLIIGR